MRLIIQALVIAGVVGAATVPAAADQYRDRVHADSFGNLVIYSAASYKRIIVGMGHAAEGYNATGSYYETEEPNVVYLEGQTTQAVRYCHRPPYRWHGRSHMYGLPENVVPQAPLVCR